MAGCFHLNSKFISKSSSPFQRCKNFMWYQVMICLQLLKKLKLYTKLGPDTVHMAPISFHIKIYLWSLVDYQHLQKYFYNWNITLNYYVVCQNNISNLIYMGMPLATSNTHISTTLLPPLWRIVTDSKSYVPAAPMICHSKFWSIFLVVKKVAYYLLACANKISN